MNIRKKIFITGKNGFIGRNILEFLGEKYDFVAPSKDELNLFDSEKVLSFLEREKPDIIIHLANIGGNRRAKKFPNEVPDNLKMFFNLVRGKKHFDRIIVFGSGAEYDKRRPLKQISEKDFDQLVPEDDYGFSKYIMSKYAEQVDFITHLRFFGIYGKYEHYETRFISNAIAKTVLDMPITVRQNVVFDYLYIDDCVKIVDYFITTKPRYTFYNIGRGQSIDLLTIAHKVARLSGENLPVVIAKEGESNEYTCNVERLQAELPNFSFTPFDKTIVDLLDYYKKIQKQLDRNLLLVDD